MEFKLRRTTCEFLTKTEIDDFIFAGFKIETFGHCSEQYGMYKFETLITMFDVTELVRLNHFVKEELILSKDTIEIYDTYRET